MTRSELLLAAAAGALLLVMTASAAPAAVTAATNVTASAPPAPEGAVPAKIPLSRESHQDLPASSTLSSSSGGEGESVELTSKERAETEALFAGAENSEERAESEEREREEKKRREKEEKKKRKEEEKKRKKEEKKRKEEEEERKLKEEEETVKESRESKEIKEEEPQGSRGPNMTESAIGAAQEGGPADTVTAVSSVDDTPIVSKSLNSGLEVSDYGPPVTLTATPAPQQQQPQHQTQPQAQPWTAAASWPSAPSATPAPGPSGSAQSPPGQPRSSVPNFNLAYTTLNPYPGPVTPGGNAPLLPNGRVITTSYSPPVPREKIISQYLQNVFQYSDTKLLLDSLKRGEPLPPVDLNGVTVHFKVTGFDGKPVVNGAGPWVSQAYAVPPAPPAAAPAPAPVPAAAQTPIAAAQNAAGQVSPIYFVSIQGKLLPVYDGTEETSAVLKQLQEINQMQVMWQRQLEQAQAELAKQQQQQQQQQPVLYHRPPSQPQDAELIQIPVPTVLKSGGSGNRLQPIKTESETIVIPVAPTSEEQRGLGASASPSASPAATDLLQPIPATPTIFSIQGPISVVANQGGPSWQSYSSAGSTASTAPASSTYGAPSPASSANSASLTSSPYSGVVTPGVPESLAEFAQAQAAGAGGASSASSAHSAPAAPAAPAAPVELPKSQVTVVGNPETGAPVRLTFSIPGANQAVAGGAPQVLTLMGSASSPGSNGAPAMSPYIQAGAPQVLTFSSAPLGGNAVLHQLPTSFWSSTGTPGQGQHQNLYQQQHQQPAQPYTVSVYATQTKD